MSAGQKLLKSVVPLLLGLAAALLTPYLLPLRAEPVLSVTGSGSAVPPGSETTLRLKLLNHTDQIVYNGILTATLPAGFSYVPGSTVLLGEGWPMDSREPFSDGQTLVWGPYHLPAAGNTVPNPYGIHTMLDSCDGIPALHLEGAKMLAGNGGYITQLFYPIDTNTTGPSQCAINFVNEAYARNLIPVLRLQGHRANSIWQAPNPGPDGDYSEIAQAYAAFVAGLPRRNTNPLYIAVWNEPDLWIEWSNKPNATQYARFFVAISNAIRQLGDGRIRIVNGALTPGNTIFLDKMLRVPGFRDAFDVWASHCYPYNHPPEYNNHNGIARYGTYAIDCYLEELAIIERYGRSDISIILTETGYRLGENLYNFEGFPTINDSNRATYIAGAFADYWQQWPEIIAATPFELTDPAGFWHEFDWVQPTTPYTPYRQFTRVAALPKPLGHLQPYGYQVIFKVSVAADVITGDYPLTLSGSEQNGSVVTGVQAATITVAAQNFNHIIYLPIILKPFDFVGPFSDAATARVSHSSDGAIAPTRLIRALPLQAIAAPAIERLALPDAPTGLAIDDESGLGGVLLAGGQLLIFDLTSLTPRHNLNLGDSPRQLIAGAPGEGQLFVSLREQVLRIDMRRGEVTATRHGLGRPGGLAWDTAARRLIVADAEQESLLLFDETLSNQLAAQPLPGQPDRLLLDSAANRLVVTLPGMGQIATFSTNTLAPLAHAEVTAGLPLDLQFDRQTGRLYLLIAPAPGRHVIAVLDAATLRQLDLLAGDPRLSLLHVSALAAAPAGGLLLADSASLWQLTPTDTSARRLAGTGGSVPPGGIIATESGAIYLLNPGQSLLLRLTP